MEQQLGPYQLVERLGVGGMAEVFLAHARREGDFVQPCVVKILHSELADDPEFTGMLAEEAKLVARLRHSNIASLYDVGRKDGKTFLVMEHVDGRDLHAILAQAARQERSLPIPFAVHVGQQVCAGLHFAHTRRSPDGEALNLVHRDISPPNVLVSTLGEVKIIDFGVAKFNSAAREKTRAGVIKGKFGYMSPEQAWDEDLDQRSDLFSVGICLYEMLSGRSLYGQAEDVVTMVRRAREADIAPVTKWRPDVPDELARVVHRALEPNRDARFQNAHALERQLSAILARQAPDFTALDAGAVVGDIFDIGDPALNTRSPHLSAPISDNPDQPGDQRAGDVSEDTQPMVDAADAGIREDDAEPLDSADIEFVDADDPTGATAQVDFADFSDNEKTELFDEHRIGATENIAKTNNGNRGGPSTDGVDPNRQTRLIEEDPNSAFHDPTQAPESTDQFDTADAEPAAQRSRAPDSAPRQDGENGAPSRENEPDRTPKNAPSREPKVEPRKSQEVLATGPADVISQDRASKPVKEKKRQRMSPHDKDEDQGDKIKYYAQFIGAVAFVFLALLALVIRVSC